MSLETRLSDLAVNGKFLTPPCAAAIPFDLSSDCPEPAAFACPVTCNGIGPLILAGWGSGGLLEAVNKAGLMGDLLLDKTMTRDVVWRVVFSDRVIILAIEGVGAGVTC